MAKREFFETKIRPVLVEHCYQCHSAKSETVRGNLQVDSRAPLLRGGDSGPAVVPGAPDESLLLAALKYEGLEMPPAGKLSPQVIADFERWIREGAVDPREDTTVQPRATVDYQAGLKFWAFQRPELPAVPEVALPAATGGRWGHNAVDQFIAARLQEQDLAPRRRAAPETLIRRVYLNLIGLPPSPAEVREFVAASAAAPDRAYRELVERLLQTQQYGERWARHWLDVARYGEDQAHTFKARNYPRGYLYRDWVVRAFNDDLPYDQFLKYQIAGDLLPDPDAHERLAALGLFALGPVYYAENVERAKARADEWDDRVDTLMRGVLGLTASCARCHDHKYDPISMADYYGVAGVFASTKYEERPIVAPAVLAQRQAADAEAQRRQVAIDRFLAEQSRELRPQLTRLIPEYVAATWKLHQRLAASSDKQPSNNDVKKTAAQLSKSEKVNQTLLVRWYTYLNEPAAKTAASAKSKLAETAEMPARRIERLRNQWRAIVSESRQDEVDRKLLLEKVGQLGLEFQQTVEEQLPRRVELFRRFGENAAFVRPEDQATVRPGVIPLGNLFDDAAGVALDAALATDRYQADASADDLGVDRVQLGFGKATEIAPGVRFDFDKLGSDASQFGAVVNDAWYQGPLRTQGMPLRGKPQRAEQGIGMHANALITFDLDELRRAGLLPANQRFRFLVDRAGINDDTYGNQSSSTHVAAIVSRPHRNKTETDAILSAWVNGESLDVATNDFTYYFAGGIPEPLRADGKFISFDIPIPPEAKHLTLVSTGAGGPADNPINSDHTVLSGARLEQDPLPDATAPELAAETVPGAARDAAREQEDRRAAELLSQFLYDEGLLAVPPAEDQLQDFFDERAAQELKQLKAAHQAAKRDAEAIAVLQAHALTEGEGQDLKVYLQGDPAKQGEVAPRAMPAIFSQGETAPFNSSGSGRLELANAIASRDNPLTARVLVNRVWGLHFGQGLVRTPSNFGQLGERPSHPQLLDYLAVQFMEHGWSLKWLHRELLLSATFQQASEFDETSFRSDPENKYLWRMNRRRLEIEPWRDSLLSVSGELNLALGGPSANLADPKNVRRTLYGFVSRHKLDELLRLFDFPDPNITAARRTTTTVPLQQLFILNSDFMAQRARALAQRIDRELAAGTTNSPDGTAGSQGEADAAAQQNRRRIQYAFELLYARQPDSPELSLGRGFLSAPAESDSSPSSLSRWEQYCLALISANEFLYVD